MLGIRWTIGDVNPRGFAALRLSVWGAWRLFGPSVNYRIHVNTISLDDARARTGTLPADVEWEPVARRQAGALTGHLDDRMAEGVAWKLVPARAFPDDHELALDNDVVLWAIPRAIDDWLRGKTQFVLAADVRPAFGRFGALCGERPLNTGLRGLPPGFDLEGALDEALARSPGTLTSELDEQGLQVAAILGAGSTGVVALEDVTICSPFPPHVPHLGRAGAHFVGLNTHSLGFDWDGIPAEEVRAQHWDGLVPEITRLIGIDDDELELASAG